MGARIIWSDGSKALAHNLDDLRERWELSKQVETAGLGTRFELMKLPDWGGVGSFKEIDDLRAFAKAGRDRAMLEYGQAGFSKNGRGHQTYSEYRLRLLAESQYFEGVLSFLKSLFRDLSAQHLKENPNAEIERLMDRLRRAERGVGEREIYIRYLESILDRQNISYSRATFAMTRPKNGNG